MNATNRVTISLLHATWHRKESPLELKKAWLSSAHRPDLVDYVFAMDSDDELSVALTTGHKRVVGAPAFDNRPTSVRNWNAAADAACGELLFVIADDLYPPPDWDACLRETLGPFDARKEQFAVKINDSDDPHECLMRHPIVSRAFLEKYGLFDPGFRSVYCDNDLTLRAFWYSAILDGRHIVFTHRHPSVDATLEMSVSQQAGNSQLEYDLGWSYFEQKWPRWRRAYRPRPLRSGLGSRKFLAGRLVAYCFETARISVRIVRLASRWARGLASSIAD